MPTGNDFDPDLDEVDNLSGDGLSGREYHFEFEQELLLDIS